MVTYYLDRSALAKLYLVESGSAWERITVNGFWERISRMNDSSSGFRGVFSINTGIHWNG